MAKERAESRSTGGTVLDVNASDTISSQPLCRVLTQASPAMRNRSGFTTAVMVWRA